MTPRQSKKPAPIQSGQECGFKDTSVPLCLPFIPRIQAASSDRLASHDPRTLDRPRFETQMSRPQSLPRVYHFVGGITYFFGSLPTCGSLHQPELWPWGLN